MRLRDTLSAVFQSFRSRLTATASLAKPAGAVVLTVLLVAVLGLALFSHAHYLVTPAQDGIIIVNSPTVYTRQRLVNDRLTQATWLQDQLAVTEGTEPTFQTIDQVRIQRSSTAVKAELGINAKDTGAEKSDAPSPSASSPASGPEQPAVPLVLPTTLDLFRAKNSYRDEVRAEIMETQLDDRHDIQGNTIYRFSFDASLLPGSREDSLAYIKVTLSHNWREAQFVDDYSKLYDEWVGFTQNVLDDSVDQFARYMSDRNYLNDVHQQGPLLTYISRAVCHYLIRRRFILADPIAVRRGDPRTNPCNSQENATPNDDDIAPTANDALRVERARRSIKVQADGFMKEYIAAYMRERAMFFARGAVNAAAKTANLTDPLPPIRDLLRPLQKRCDNRAPQEKRTVPLDLPSGSSLQVPCPDFDWPQEAIGGGVLLLETLINSEADAGNRDKKPADLIHQACGGECTDKPEATSADMACFAADFTAGRLNAWYDRSHSSWERLNYFLDMRVIGRDIGNCRLVVWPKTTHHLVIPRWWQDACDGETDPASRLKCRLNQEIELYSYSITPKNMVQRISSTFDTSQALQTMLSGGANVQGQELQSMLQMLRKRSEQNRAVQSNPIVVGFGSGATRAPRSSTSFGWVIAPPLDVEGKRRQVDEQYGLAAVVSIPSWWRSVHLHIERCWISSARLHPAERTKQCPDGTATDDIVRLPGEVKGISEKLHFDPNQEPHLDQSRGKPVEVEVGQPADVVLKGGRLWRSTEVTLGAQKANQIVVLPNMEGIIATFRCVTPQTFLFGRVPDKGEVTQEQLPTTRIVPIRVWTSEGVTPPSDVWVVMREEMKQILTERVKRHGESRLPNVCSEDLRTSKNAGPGKDAGSKQDGSPGSQ